MKYAVAVALLATGSVAMAQTNTPVVPIDTSLTYTALSSPFNAAMVWVVGATARPKGKQRWIHQGIEMTRCSRDWPVQTR